MDDLIHKDVINAVIFHGNEPEGIVQMPAERMPQVLDALKRDGIRVEPAEKTGDNEYDFTDECNEENTKPCEIATGLGMIQGYAKSAGVDSHEIEALKQGKMPTDTETKRAMDAVIARMNPDSDEGYSANMLRKTVFGDHHE